jgi:hypothetical protein
MKTFNKTRGKLCLVVGLCLPIGSTLAEGKYCLFRDHPTKAHITTSTVEQDNNTAQAIGLTAAEQQNVSGIGSSLSQPPVLPPVLPPPFTKPLN